MEMKKREKWTTQDEIDFVRTLGTHREGAPKRVEDVPLRERLRLLRNYKKTMHLRARWGGIDPFLRQLKWLMKKFVKLSLFCPRHKIIFLKRR